MHILFVAPRSNLDTGTELTRVASGNRPEIVSGAVDRAGLERALRAAQYDAIHFAGHGSKGVLELTDGLLDEADLVSMCEDQRHLQFVIVNACNSLALGTALHNELHVPIIAHDAEIGDGAANRFVETFYRAYKQTCKVKEAFERGVRTLERLFPDESTTPVLINGDMATTGQLNDCLDYVGKEIGAMRNQLDDIERSVSELRASKSDARTFVVLVVVLIVTQLVSPMLSHFLFGG